jgi:VWFA-related protein
MKLSRNLLLLFTLVLVPLAGVPAGAQDDAPSDLFVDRVDVNVVNVEVFVTDDNGYPVIGLSQRDFQILEDGAPVEITNFYSAVRDDRRLLQLEAQRAEAQDAGAAPPPVALHPEDQVLNLMVYVDNLNLHTRSRNRVLDQLDGFLEDRMAQGDRVMLVGFDRDLEVIMPFTADRQQIGDGLERLKKQTARRQTDDALRRQTMRQIEASAKLSGQGDLPGPDLRSAYEFVRSYVQQAEDDLQRSTEGLQQVVRWLSGMPGRRAILYVSDGLSQRPGEELYQHLADSFGSGALNQLADQGGFVDPTIEAVAGDRTKIIERVAIEANAHQVTFYTLDAGGTNSESTASAEYADLSASPGGHTSFDQLRQSNLQDPLVELAVRTGGDAILNTFNFDGAAAGMARDFDSFYSLGFRSPNDGDGKSHKIDVQLTRPGFKVRHRSSYVAKPEEERLADRTLSSLMLGLETNPLGIGVEFGTPEKSGRNRYELPVLVRVPFAGVTLLPSGANEQGKLQILVQVQDEKGNVSPLHRHLYPVTVPADQVAAARGQDIGYQVKLEVREGTPKIAVAVWDELSGTQSFVLQRVLVGEAKKRGRDGR